MSTRIRLTPLTFVLTMVLSLSLVHGPAHAAPPSPADDQARQILTRLGIDRGICVLLGPEPADVAVALAQRSELTLYLQLPSRAAEQVTRERVDAARLLGTRIYVESGPWSHLHLADNLADAVVVLDAAVDAIRPHRGELLRVVNPTGKVLLGPHERSKPYPPDADSWSHPYHGPDNNPLSADRLARAPYLTQFHATPWYVPMPEVTVIAGGRIFKALGHIAMHDREWPWMNTLVALNGYNGTLLWKRPLEPGFMIHRNTMVATPEVLYQADNDSCKVIDARTGRLTDEITAPPNAAGGAWKWMALDNGILYALVGEREAPDPIIRRESKRGGWPWNALGQGYAAKEYRWGFGHTLFAIDAKTRRVLWTHTESDPIDGRAVCMKAGRLYYYSHPNFLACLDATRGKSIWRTQDAKLLAAIGPHFRAQRARWGFSSTNYMKCTEQAIYFAGPQRKQLVAASTEDGRLLWQYGHGNFQLVLRDDGVYALGTTHPKPDSKKFDPLTGDVLAELPCLRGNCTRVTGSVDSIFGRGHHHGGTLRLTLEDHRPQRIPLMRPPCQDGVMIADGQLYWGPWMCACNLSSVGTVCLSPAGDFPFHQEAIERERLEASETLGNAITPLAIAPGDWPVYRATNRRRGSAAVEVPSTVALAWEHRLPAGVEPAAPVTAGGLVFLSGSDGAVRVIDATDGTIRWTTYTGGPILYPPAIDEGRLFVGSGDGWIYAFEAVTGRPLWRFRAAPANRKIHHYGRLTSTWPVASGVLVDQGVVYAAAGIANHDGTHVYALDAATGRIRWQNNTSGQLGGVDNTVGVSVQGHLLLHDDRLYLAGGNVVSPAVYALQDGRCLSMPGEKWDSKAPCGRELFVLNDKVTAFDQLLYAPKDYHRGNYFARHFLQVDADDVVIRGVVGHVERVAPHATSATKPKAMWQSTEVAHPVAMALGKNAVVVAGREQPSGTSFALAALSVSDGRRLWNQTLPAMPGSWKMALDAAGRILVAMRDGRVSCFVSHEGL